MKSQICKLIIVAAVLGLSAIFCSPLTTICLSASFGTVFMSADDDE